MSALDEALGRDDLSKREKALAILLFAEKRRIKPIEIKKLGVAAGLREIQRWNCSDLLGKDRAQATNYPDGWQITPKGVAHLATKNVVKDGEIQRAAATELRAVLTKIKSDHVRAFVEEAVQCYECKLYRAAVVLSWVGAVALLYETVIGHHLAKLNAEARRVNAKWKDATVVDHLSLLDEGDFLDLIASPNVGVLVKNVKENLKHGPLKLRNSCGHPNSLAVGPAQVAAHIETLILNVFSKFA